MNWQLFSAFFLITTILIIVPGPVVTLVIATGAQRGIRPARATVLGTMAGTAVLLAGIGFGLGWLLKMSSELFEVMRWAGAAYLFYLGIQAWRHAADPVPKLKPRHNKLLGRISGIVLMGGGVWLSLTRRPG